MAACILFTAQVALAEQPPPAATEDDATVAARRAFQRGVELVKAAEWAEALASFEQSRKLRPHAVTSYNIGACQKALGRYSAARITLERALSESTEDARLPDDLAADARAFLAAIDGLLVRAVVHVKPTDIRVAVDGRPLTLLRRASGHALYATNVQPEPGRGTLIRESTFELVLDPGPHLITLSRTGYTDAVVNKSFAQGERSSLNLDLDLLPATVQVRANVQGALVTLDGADLGPVPVEVKRPAGTYTIRVAKSGYQAWENVLSAKPGQQASLEAKLSVHKPALTERWWFWAGAAAVVAGGAALTYALTRPEPQPPAYETGNTGWLAKPSSIRF